MKKKEPRRWREKRDVVIRGERVRELRERRGLTQLDFAALLKTSISNVSSIENNHRDTSVARLVDILDALNVDSADYLIGRTDTPPRLKS